MECVKMKADISIDCLGLFCPMPIIKTAEAIKKINMGQVLEVIADDEGIVEDMPNWCKMTGNEHLGIEEDGDEYKTYVKKTISE
jgi:tRNA 2-thiouridine synthesizing protein A